MILQRTTTALSGFTLIEVLVVISILSFLSSIVLASVSKAKLKASNVVNNVLFGKYKDSLRDYYGEKGEFPNTGVGNTSVYCVGAEPCWANSSEQSMEVNNALLSYMNALPNLNKKPLDIGFPWPYYWSGLGYSCSESFHVTCNVITLSWVLEGYPTDCKFSPRAISAFSYDYAGNTYCLMTVSNGNL